MVEMPRAKRFRVKRYLRGETLVPADRRRSSRWTVGRALGGTEAVKGAGTAEHQGIGGPAERSVNHSEDRLARRLTP